METIRALDNSIFYYLLRDDGTFPNNAHLPAILYKGVWKSSSKNLRKFAIQQLDLHAWQNAWVSGILKRHHYHSTAHEVLVAVRGATRLQLGGKNGVVLDFEKGDVLVIPAGVAHKNIRLFSPWFRCVGAYPEGQFYDICYGKRGERPQTDKAIEKVQLPTQDPVFGFRGPLLEQWHVK